MDAVETNTFDSFLAQLDDSSWAEALDSLVPRIHPVDQEATRIWFAFWPLHLLRTIQKSENIEQMEQQLELKGRYRLEEQLDSSVHFLFGSQYWPEVKEAISSHAEASTSMDGSLGDQIQAVAQKLASSLQIPESHVIGITAVALMALRQVGLEVFSAPSTQPTPRQSSPDRILKARARRREAGWVFCVPSIPGTPLSLTNGTKRLFSRPSRGRMFPWPRGRIRETIDRTIRDVVGARFLFNAGPGPVEPVGWVF